MIFINQTGKKNDSSGKEFVLSGKRLVGIGKKYVAAAENSVDSRLDWYYQCDLSARLKAIGKKRRKKMTEIAKIDNLEEKSRRGFKRYGRNPSVPDGYMPEVRKRPVRIPGSDTGVKFVDDTTGELVGQGVRHFMKFEEVDASKFVKLFLDGMKQAAGLKPKSGMVVFEIVYRLLQEKPNSDEVALSWRLAADMGYKIPERTFRDGLRQLLEREFLYESLVEGVYFVNITYMFNGDRLTFIRGYKLKNAAMREKHIPVPLLGRTQEAEDSDE